MFATSNPVRGCIYRELRIRAGVTVEQMEREIGLSRQRIVSIENGHDPTLEEEMKFLKLCQTPELTITGIYEEAMLKRARLLEQIEAVSADNLNTLLKNAEALQFLAAYFMAEVLHECRHLTPPELEERLRIYRSIAHWKLILRRSIKELIKVWRRQEPEDD